MRPLTSSQRSQPQFSASAYHRLSDSTSHCIAQKLFACVDDSRSLSSSSSAKRPLTADQSSVVATRHRASHHTPADPETRPEVLQAYLLCGRRLPLYQDVDVLVTAVPARDCALFGHDKTRQNFGQNKETSSATVCSLHRICDLTGSHVTKETGNEHRRSCSPHESH